MSNDYSSSQSSLPIHLCFFLLTLFMFISFSWYMNYESIFEGFFGQIKLALIVSPLILLLALHLFSNFNTRGRSPSSFFLPLPERESFHRAGGTPWGVGLLLVLLFFMISHQSSFQERWFPLLSR
ncbi:hypothetical protein CsSME_00011912 [Camellia sinensis var. sinensis]|uniref:Uncharacterized protein n=2 Tax=Camellia sinensis TaxID=4442 RepID=A0A7J7HKZ2_CAMSI|nr:hypothetical protein HYC85_010608 [Camellia sinensis]THG20342.1 hypothetical protein TEA_003682 [Camellia sinensis var. sinensis]